MSTGISWAGSCHGRGETQGPGTNWVQTGDPVPAAKVQSTHGPAWVTGTAGSNGSDPLGLLILPFQYGIRTSYDRFPLIP